MLLSNSVIIANNRAISINDNLFANNIQLCIKIIRLLFRFTTTGTQSHSQSNHTNLCEESQGLAATFKKYMLFHICVFFKFDLGTKVTTLFG